MSEAPFVPFYTSDFLAGTSGMTASSKGVYITLLCLMYEQEAPLPQSWETLARRCGCTLPAFKRAIESLQDDGKITVSDAGIWSPKCDKHIAQRRERQISARAAAKTRWEKDKKKQRPVDATASIPQCEPYPEPEAIKREAKASLVTEPAKRKRKVHQDTPEFCAFWEAYPRQEAKGAARKAFAAASLKADPAIIIAAARRVEDKGQYTKHPATWLNKECWLDQETRHEPNHPPRRPGSGHALLDAAARAVSRLTTPGDDQGGEGGAGGGGPAMDFGSRGGPSLALLAGGRS